MQLLPFMDSASTPIDGRTGDSTGTAQGVAVGEEMFAALLAAMTAAHGENLPVPPHATIEDDGGAPSDQEDDAGDPETVLGGHGPEATPPSASIASLTGAWAAQAVTASIAPTTPIEITPEHVGTPSSNPLTAFGRADGQQPVDSDAAETGGASSLAPAPASDGRSSGGVRIDALGMEPVIDPLLAGQLPASIVAQLVDRDKSGIPIIAGQTQYPNVESGKTLDSAPAVPGALAHDDVPRLTLLPSAPAGEITPSNPRVVVFSRENEQPIPNPAFSDSAISSISSENVQAPPSPATSAAGADSTRAVAIQAAEHMLASNGAEVVSASMLSQAGSLQPSTDPTSPASAEVSEVDAQSSVESDSIRPVSGEARGQSVSDTGRREELPLEARGEAGPREVSPREQPRTYDENIQATAAINQAASSSRPLTPIHAVSREVTMWLHQPMIAQIARGVEMAAEQPGQAVHVRLHPEGLGAVTLEVGMAGTDVHVHIAVDNPGTRDLIQSNWSSLSHTLSDQGLTIAGAQVELSGGSGRGGAAAGEQSGAWRPAGQHARSSGASDDQSGVTLLANRSSASGVDYRV